MAEIRTSGTPEAVTFAAKLESLNVTAHDVIPETVARVHGFPEKSLEE